MPNDNENGDLDGPPEGNQIYFRSVMVRQLPLNLYHNWAFNLIIPRSRHHRSVDQKSTNVISREPLPQPSHQLVPQQLQYAAPARTSGIYILVRHLRLVPFDVLDAPASVNVPEHMQPRTDLPQCGEQRVASKPVRVEVSKGRTMCDEDISERRNMRPDLVCFGWWAGGVRWVDAGILEGPRAVFGRIWAAENKQLASAYGEFDR